jgi:vacuolar-type H+-ATPase subunit I/STV1
MFQWAKPLPFRLFAKKRGSVYSWKILPPMTPVPTLVENNSAIGTIRPVLDFLGTTPGYYEKDISLWFLIFFAMSSLGLFWVMQVMGH